MKVYVRSAVGSIIRGMVSCGCRMWNRGFSRTERMDIGCLQMLGGLGIPIILGVGDPFITDVGFMIRFMGGPGYPVINGVVLGWCGVTAMDTMVGDRLDQGCP